METLVMKAARFAAKAHAGQFRKDGKTPAIVHPARVAGRVAVLPFATDELVAVAYLHDVMEDCPITHDDLVREFGAEVADLVDFLTKKKTGGNREARLTAYFQMLGEAPAVVHAVKALDRIDNLRDLALLSGHGGFAKEYLAETHRLSLFIPEAGKDLLAEMHRTAEMVLNTVTA